MMPAESRGAMQRKTIDLIVGKPVSPAEEAQDAAKHPVVKGSAVPPPDDDTDVAGRGSQYKYMCCPSDKAVNYVLVEDYTFTWYRCWNCNCLFKV
jgi:hypothetical protein